MRIHIFGQSFRPTEAIVRHAENRVAQALAPAGDRVAEVHVRLTDVNGDHGGPDKRCRLVVASPDATPLVVEAVDANLYAAVDAAASRAKEAITRRLKRRRTLTREYAHRAASR